jgi:protein-S-isoprenylcysteine O-methyltransferase Ste14
MDLVKLPALIAALCLTIYWAWVLVKLVQLGRKLGKDPNAMPRERVGQAMRLLWYPCIFVLLSALWMSLAGVPRWLGPAAPLFTRLWPPNLAWQIAAIAATLLCIVCTIISFICWRKMGRSWRIGIDPGEKLDIVSTGPYRFVRHPIYALRMLINICACIMVPTPLVIITAAIDFVLLQVEARREERYMESKHGDHYARYKNSVGRFVPRASSV